MRVKNKYTMTVGVVFPIVFFLVFAANGPLAWSVDGSWPRDYQFAPDSGIGPTAFGQRSLDVSSAGMSAGGVSPNASCFSSGSTTMNAIPSGPLANAAGVGQSLAATTPNMIGDTLNNGFGGMRFFGLGALAPIITPNGATIGISGGDRRFKIADDEHPIPIDRIFFDFNHFQYPVMDISGTRRNLDRYTFGLEKTFRDGLWSFGFRVPFASGYDATQSITPGAGLSATEFGDMSLVLKRILLQRERLAISAGLSTVFPSGPDFRISDATGVWVEVQNESVHLGPFVGLVLAPTDRLFFLAFGQIDFDTGGSTVLMRDALGTPGSLANQGTFYDQTRGFLDLSVGYRVYQNPYASILTAVTPMVELHYTSTLTNMDYVAGPLGAIGETATGGTGRRDILNITAGLHFQFGELTSMTFAGVAPLTNNLNREFDSELLVQFNRRF